MTRDQENSDSSDEARRETTIREIVALLEDALRRCDTDALHIAAIHIDRAIHECGKQIAPPQRPG